MAIDTITPVASSVIEPGDSVSFKVDDTYTTLTIQVQAAGGLEAAYSGLVAQPGYTVGIVNSGGRDTFTVGRDAGWDKSPQAIIVTEDEAGPSAQTTFSYVLSTTALYPQGSQPYNAVSVGTLTVSEDEISVRQDVGQIDFDDATFDITDLGGGKVKVTAISGGTGNVVGPASATDNAVTLYDSTTGKLIKDSATLVYSGGELRNTSATASSRFSERTTGPTGVVDSGHFWVRDDVPSVPMFTSDTDVDTKIGANWDSFGSGGRCTGAVTGTWYSTIANSPWADGNAASPFGAGANPGTTLGTYASVTHIMPQAGKVRAILTEWTSTISTVDGKSSWYKLVTTDGGTSSTNTLLGADTDLADTILTNSIYHTFQTGLSDAVAQGDKLKWFYNFATTPGTLFLTTTLFVEFD